MATWSRGEWVEWYNKLTIEQKKQVARNFHKDRKAVNDYEKATGATSAKWFAKMVA